MPSPVSAATFAAFGPNAETTIWMGSSGGSKSWAFSTVKWVPWRSTTSPVQSARITAMASSSISWRISTAGQRWPRTCSFNASPVPTPRKKRPSKSCAVVAAAWATIAGCTRRIGQVTPVPTRTRSVAPATAPSTDQTKGLCPCSVVQGWK